MRGDRYVVLGLASVRSPWFREVARWSTSASLPLEFVKCVSVEEVRARLGTGRAFSALLVDAAAPGFDRDVIDAATTEGCAVIVVDDGLRTRDWVPLGAKGVLAPSFGRAELVDVLASVAAPIERADAVAAAGSAATFEGWRGRLYAVTGTGGAGTSTVAMALAQGLGLDPRTDGSIVLADLALHADQAMLHDAADIVPALSELVEAHRSGAPSAQEVRSLTFAVPDRGYQLLLGLRRHRDWSTLRPKAVAAALDGLRRAFHGVVADVTGDFEGQDACGSADVEDRNHLARLACAEADLVLVVASPGPRGVHRLVRLVEELLALGVPPTRIVPVINRSPRSPRARAEITRAVAELTAPLTIVDEPLNPALHLAERRHLDDLVRDGARLPSHLVEPVARAASVALARLEELSAPVAIDRFSPRLDAEPVAVVPGSLGSFYDEEAWG